MSFVEEINSPEADAKTFLKFAENSSIHSSFLRYFPY